MYSIGTVFFFSALAFSYYSFQCAKVMKGALGRRIMAYAGVLFIVAEVIGAIDALFFPGSGLVYGEFLVWLIALVVLVFGGFLVGKTIQKAIPASLIKLAFTIRRGIYYLMGIVALLFVGLPVFILDLWPLRVGFSWYSVISIAIWAFCFTNLAIGTKADYSVARPSAAAAAAAADSKEIALLRDDIIAVRTYGAITNMVLATAKPAVGDKLLRDVLTEHLEYNPLLFEGCEIRDNGAVNTEPIVKNLDRLHEKERVQLLCKEFSTLNSKIMNLYGVITSPELAKQRLEESYLIVKKQYGDLPIFFDILRSLPKGVLEDERLKLLSREELEARVKERTAELEKACKELARITVAERERAEELKDARDVLLSVLEDTDEAKKELEKAKIELEKAKTGLEEKVKERTAELEEAYKKLVKTEAAAAAAAADKARLEEAEKYSKELEKAYEELKSLDKMKSDFISIAAHELRTPLTPVKVYVDLIKANKVGKITWKQKEKLDMVSENLDRLARLIDDMLDITRIEARKLELKKEWLLIGEVIDIALDEVKSVMPDRKRRISIYVPDDLPTVYADKELITKVFTNLLSNAIKYTTSTTDKITVEAREEGKNIHITVADTGIGIPKEKQEKIFEKFYVVDTSLTRRYRGIGLGLAIAKGIVEGHDGKIWVESEVGKGSVFHVVLPVMEAEKIGGKFAQKIL
ncbi:MAG: ATP-binding protein [Candidatus Thermoplasmatota archaeon]